MISFDSVTKVYPKNNTKGEETIALDNVSFSINDKEFISLVGRSGAGKTTLFRLLMAEEKPTSGTVVFDGQDINKVKSNKIFQLRRRIGAIFQDYKLLKTKTAYENIAYVMEVIGANKDEVKRDVEEVLKIVGLTDKASHFPHELSGGERQRVAIARALIHRPEIILADEPTGNLDPYNTLEILKLLLKINDLGTTVIFATHNKEIVNSLKRRVITIDDGRLVRDEQEGRFVI